MRIRAQALEESEGDFQYRYNFLTFYQKVFSGRLKERKYPYYKTLCPFHDDRKTPNLDINVISGRYTCYACGKHGGHWDFIITKDENGHDQVNVVGELLNGTDLKKALEYDAQHAASEGASELTLRVEEKRAEQAHALLMQIPLLFNELKKKRGLTEESIRRWRLGTIRGTTSIPIPDIKGNMATLKVHKQYQTSGAHPQIFPWESVTDPKKKYCVLHEGEFDTIITIQMGLNSANQIFGANSWDTGFNEYFRNKRVYIAYDKDDAGRKGTLLVARSLWKSGITAFMVEWPSWMLPGESSKDFFIKYKKTKDDYISLLEEAKQMTELHGYS